MKQGRASVESGYRKREPNPHAKVPAGVAQIGVRVGNHVTEQGSTGYGGVSRDGGKGYRPPVDAGRTIHKGGSQGRR